MLKYKNNINEIGLDEAGRGPLIGRVYAGAVIWEQEKECDIIKDSKKLTPKKRAIALDWIKNNIKYWGVGYADEKEIDKINILNATKLAMDRAIDNLKTTKGYKYTENVSYLLIDGTGWEKKFKNYNVESIIKGDSLYYSIAAASIIAKEHHDMYIRELISIDPTLDEKYSLSSNMGYPTAKHFDGIKKHGCSEYHRKSFKGVL
uniref:Ribonuclease HII n=1 Tax=viral metagenome TaxID=1070528 RepID=A0A6C0HW09_9ZZZZ